ncbi:hypothetical protein UFOVP881_8 [uncultured Caudovirales phage]|uniref:Uncharacterized protein n=1 Tax=uncultured Caudovirales phage TaxID=2100421 RepID=A0A6J5R9H8_9CAUD|nr:hypothetical protein UFOVP881_8 [uncultured Caudovirales phage]CAB4191037.1 hypothetical protein UFOVP1216_5 [uncultured Caudovirales phage]CAB4194825.1 hypothetical protein UFOVP1272_5 [uncultured Caudovirales phage]
MSDSVEIAYDKADLRRVLGAFKAMSEEATIQAKQESSALAEYVQSKIVDAAATRGTGAIRVALGARVSKSSKIGEISFGFASQKFSGGGTTQQLWGGLEFGSNTKKQFPVWSGKQGRGSRGWFIYPTLREIQPELIEKWEYAFDKILKEF